MPKPLRSSEHDDLELLALLGLGALAALFVTEPESWPVFKIWVESNGTTGQTLDASRETVRQMADAILNLSNAGHLKQRTGFGVPLEKEQ